MRALPLQPMHIHRHAIRRPIKEKNRTDQKKALRAFLGGKDAMWYLVFNSINNNPPFYLLFMARR